MTNVKGPICRTKGQAYTSSVFRGGPNLDFRIRRFASQIRMYSRIKKIVFMIVVLTCKQISGQRRTREEGQGMPVGVNAEVQADYFSQVGSVFIFHVLCRICRACVEHILCECVENADFYVFMHERHCLYCGS